MPVRAITTFCHWFPKIAVMLSPQAPNLFPLSGEAGDGACETFVTTGICEKAEMLIESASTKPMQRTEKVRP